MSIKCIISNIFANIPNILLIKMILYFDNDPFYVGGNWYLSSMILSIFILCPLLLYNYNWSSKLIFPIIGVLGLDVLYSNFGTIINFPELKILSLRCGLIRGICESALGVWAYEITEELKQCRLTKLAQFSLLIIKYLLLCYVLFYAYGIWNDGFLSVIALIFSLIIIILSFSNQTIRIPYNKITEFMGKISLPIYLVHYIVLENGKILLYRLNINCNLYIVISLMLLSIVFAILIFKLVDLITKYNKFYRIFLKDA